MVPTGIARCKRQPVFKENVTWHLRFSTSNVRLSNCTRNHFNTILTATISHRSLGWKNPYDTHDHKTRTRTASCNWLLTYVTRWLCIDEIFILFCFILIQLIVCLLCSSNLMIVGKKGTSAKDETLTYYIVNSDKVHKACWTRKLSDKGPVKYVT